MKIAPDTLETMIPFCKRFSEWCQSQMDLDTLQGGDREWWCWAQRKEFLNNVMEQLLRLQGLEK